MSKLTLETLGNATLVVCEDGRPVIATDPRLKGTVISEAGRWIDRLLLPSFRRCALPS